MRTIVCGLILWFGLVSSAMAAEKLDGHYYGMNGSDKVSAVFETMSTTVTGVLTLGEKRYLLQVEAEQGVYKGQLSDMENGSNMPVKFTRSNNGLNVEITPPSDGTVQFLLQADR